MPKIVETIITTQTAKGDFHIAPLGLIEQGEHWIIAPFRPSRTLDNLMAVPRAIASHTDDVRVFAGAVTGRKSWPLIDVSSGHGMRLESAVSHWELAVDRVDDHDLRPRFFCKLLASETHRHWEGFTRAKAAVLECAVLVTRLNMLPPEKVESELKYLDIAISKTAGPIELEAWGWLMERIDAWRQSIPAATRVPEL